MNWAGISSRGCYTAGRTSLIVGFSVAMATVIIGTIIGALSGYFGGWVDTVFMRFVDVMYSLPTLFLNILVLALFGDKFIYMILILSLTSWMGVARLVRGSFWSGDGAGTFLAMGRRSSTCRLCSPLYLIIVNVNHGGVVLE